MDLDRYSRARCSLEGLSVGDAFGERFFITPDSAMAFIADRGIPPYDSRMVGEDVPWTYTDDTNMALSIVDGLRRFGRIDPDWLAGDFAGRYDRGRGYGPAMHEYLQQIRLGADWRMAAPALFRGSGSFGNGAAMRVAPLGGYFADDLDSVVEATRLSAIVTHAHPEAIAGAIAVAAAAALAWQARSEPQAPRGAEFIVKIVPLIPESEVRIGVERACLIAPGTPVSEVARTLGNGSGVSAQDTVPFTLWCAAQRLDDFEAALWLTVSALGDRDTTCAIVGGIVALYTGETGIPEAWRSKRERLPAWV